MSTIIDLDVDQVIITGWSTHPEDQLDSRVRGKFECGRTRTSLHYNERLQVGGPGITGHEQRKMLEGQPVLPASLLDYWLANPHYIPEECRGKVTYFWGRIYRDSAGVDCVRFLHSKDGPWNWSYWHLRRRMFFRETPAIVLAS